VLLAYRTADTQYITIGWFCKVRIHVFINEQAVSGPHAGFDAYGATFVLAGFNHFQIP
jgi:hypothetical protein